MQNKRKHGVRLGLNSSSSIYNRIKNIAKIESFLYGIKIQLYANYNHHVKIDEHIHLTVKMRKNANLNAKSIYTK